MSAANATVGALSRANPNSPILKAARPLAPDSPRWPVSRHGGVEPVWTRSGEVFFRQPVARA